MLIILEGPEAAGKTTLGRKLAYMTGFKLTHRNKPNTQAEKDAMHRMYKEAVYGNETAIFDRCWYSEMVYGKVMRDKSYISEEQMLELEDVIVRNNGGCIIYCTDNVDALWERSKIRGEDYITKYSDLKAIKEEYDRLMYETSHKIPVFTYELSKKM